MIWIKREKINFKKSDPRQYQSHIYVTKGDDLILNVTPYDKDGNKYSLKSGDSLTLTVRKTTSSDELIKIEAASNRIIIPKDATDLDFGDYFYDIQADLNTGERMTVIPYSQFTICEEVTD